MGSWTRGCQSLSIFLLCGRGIGFVEVTHARYNCITGGQKRVGFVQNEKYSANCGGFLSFFAYLCHVIDEYTLNYSAAEFR